MPFSKEQKKLMQEMLDLDGAVVHEDCDPFATGIESPSPSFNYCFDNSWMLPQGYTLLLGGMPKGGKSLLVSAMFGKLHQADPDAVVIKYNTEIREKVQVTPAQLRLWGIDPARYRAYDTNHPENIFDPIEKNIPKLVQAGIKVRAVAIDSINDILGRRAMNAESISVQQRGDDALTQGDGLKRIKGILRQYGISLILTCQVRAEQDPNEQAKHVFIKLAVPWYVKHSAEYFMMVERLKTKSGRTDLTGKEFKDESMAVNLDGKQKMDGEEYGHKVRVTMLDSSLGRPGRVGVFTLDHDKGIINTHEEVLLLGIGFNVVAVAGGGNYSFNAHDAMDEKVKPFLEKSWRGKEAMSEAIRDNADLYQGILRTCKRIDLDRKAGITYDAEGKRKATPSAEVPAADSGVTAAA
jgi:hypothetical protein